MRLRSLLVLLVLLVAAGAACSNHKKECRESVSARAGGRYADPAAEKAAYDSKHYACVSACYDLFDTGMSLEAIKSSDVCVEDALLMATVDPLKAKQDLIDGCRDGAGNVHACAWIEANQASFGAWEAEAERDAAARATAEEAARAARGPQVSEMTMTVDEYVGLFKQAAASNGFTVMGDDTYSMASGYSAFEFQTAPGVRYVVLLVAPDTTSFTARVDGWGVEPIPMYAPEEVPRGVFARHAKFELGDAEDTSPQIVWYTSGGDGGDVRAIVLSK